MGGIDSMKYVVTQKQIDGLRETILNYLDSNLTPYEGWRNRNDYARVVDMDSEIFLHLVESEGWGEDPHMWYSVHTNPHADVPKEISPLITLPSSVYERIEAFFGNLWKPFFKEWFEANTGLKVKTVEKQDW